MAKVPGALKAAIINTLRQHVGVTGRLVSTKEIADAFYDDEEGGTIWSEKSIYVTVGLLRKAGFPIWSITGPGGGYRWGGKGVISVEPEDIPPDTPIGMVILGTWRGRLERAA